MIHPGLGMIALTIVLSISSKQTESANRRGRQILPALHACVPGSQTLYRLEYSSSSHSDPNALLGRSKSGETSPLTQSTEIESTVGADLAVTIINPEKSGCMVIFELRQPKVTLLVNGREASAQISELEKSLSIEIIGRLRLDGRIEAVAFDPTVGHLSRSYGQTILAMTQFVSPSVPAETWEVEEEDPSGRYVAQYRLAADQRARYEKTKLRYQLSASEDELTLVTTPSGLLTAVVGRDGRIESLEGEETQRITVGNRLLARATNRLRLQAHRRGALSRSQLTEGRSRVRQRLATAELVSLSTRSWDEAARIARHEQTLAGATTADLLSELRRLEDEPDPSAEAMLGRKIGALLFLHPRETPSFAAVLPDVSADSVSIRVVPAALSRAGTPEAQEALSAALGNRAGEPRLIFELTTALSMVEKPTLRAEQALRQVAFASSSEEISYSSQLALATMARNLAASGSTQRADAIVRDLTSERQGDTSDKGIERMLTILGNSGSARAFAVIEPFTSHETPRVRERAIHALRFLTTPESEALILQALSTDSSPDVREEAASILGERRLVPHTLEVQKQRYATETTVPVRLALLNSIARAADEDPAIRAMLESATADASEEIRKAASRHLSRLSLSSQR